MRRDPLEVRKATLASSWPRPAPVSGSMSTLVMTRRVPLGVVASTTRRQFALDTHNILEGLLGAQVHCRSDPAAQRTLILMN